MNRKPKPVAPKIARPAVVPTRRIRRNGIAIIATILSMGGFLLNDTIVKLANDGDVPLTQIVVIRGMFASVILLIAVFVMGAGKSLPRMTDKLAFGRSFMEVIGTFLFLTALFNMPIANVTTIFQCVPFIMTILAVVFLGEKVGVRRWLAIIIGFFGVLLVMQPGAGDFNIYAGTVLLAALAIAIRDILTRRIDPDIPSITVSLLTSLQVLCAAAIASVFEEWVPVTASMLFSMAAASVCVVIGYFCIVYAMRIGEVSVVAPFRYTVIIFSIISGYFVWGDVPTFSAMVGILLITASGIFVFLRERRVERPIAIRQRRSPGGGI